MMKTTRRNFIGTLAGVIAVPTFGLATKKKKDEFQDIRVDRYYVLKGGQYKDTGGIGCPGVSLGSGIVEDMDWQLYCRSLDRWIEHVEKSGYYLEVSGYFGPDNAKQFGKIQLKRDWLMKFYNLHRNETKEDWEKKYDQYLKSIKKV